MTDTPFTCGGCFEGYDDIDDARSCCPDYATLVSSDADWPPAEDKTPAALTKTYGKSVFDPRWGNGEPRYPDEYDAHAQAEVRGRMRAARGRF